MILNYTIAKNTTIRDAIKHMDKYVNKIRWLLSIKS